jgi:UDPglucose 6-dehydrogenase
LGMGMDKRIGNNYLQPGIGFGGSCLPKDLVGLIALCRQQNYPGLLFNAVKSINELQPEYLVRRILATIEPSGVEIELAILGLSFKPGTDDIRSAPALKLIDLFYQQGMKIRAYDPVVKSLPGEYGEKVKIYPTALEAIRGVQVVIIATEWEEFKQLNWEGVRDAEDDFLIGDGRNLLDPEEMGKLGIRYLGIGRRNGVEK